MRDTIHFGVVVDDYAPLDTDALEAVKDCAPFLAAFGMVVDGDSFDEWGEKWEGNGAVHVTWTGPAFSSQQAAGFAVEELRYRLHNAVSHEGRVRLLDFVILTDGDDWAERVRVASAHGRTWVQGDCLSE